MQFWLLKTLIVYILKNVYIIDKIATKDLLKYNHLVNRAIYHLLIDNCFISLFGLSQQKTNLSLSLSKHNIYCYSTSFFFFSRVPNRASLFESYQIFSFLFYNSIVISLFFTFIIKLAFLHSCLYFLIFTFTIC